MIQVPARLLVRLAASPRHHAVVLLAILGAAAGARVLAQEPAQHLERTGEPFVEYQSTTDRLTLSATGQRFSEVMARVADATGVRVSIQGANVVDGETWLELADVSLESGLVALLKGKDYAMARAQGEARVEAIWVLSEGDGSAATRRNLIAPPPSIPATPREVSDEQKASIIGKLQEYQASTGRDPREQLDQLRVQIAPDQRSFYELSDEEIPDALLEMMLRGSAATLRTK